MPVVLEAPSRRRQSEFLAAVRRSRTLHGAFVTPPRTSKAFESMLARFRSPRCVGHFVCADAELVGVINLNEIVMGVSRSAYLGYYAFAPYAGRGYMTEGLGLVIRRAFNELGLHRVEANIQPENLASRAVVRKLGFRLEGFSPRYLKLCGRWRDHERWALTVEEWRPRRARRGRQ